ncbi:MAG: restriction endonuclease, partial [Chlorobiales bacterium]|nr:restriction endonuclease [Chlorobiales bacterium]
MTNTRSRHLGSNLHTHQVGAYFEYFMKMEFTMYGFEVYTAEVDDRGVDFVARKDKGKFVKVQAKSLRDFGYVFMRKTHFTPKAGLYVALGLLEDGREPLSFLIPSLVWTEPDGVFVDRNYDAPGQKSAPEWGLNFSRKSL